jgi:ATP-dependent exoDNAse (exonuclease V) alpha subunit
LKVGANVMLLRNLQGDRGLCNGTRLQICRVKPTLIDGMILNGRGTGNRVIIPRLELSAGDGKLPFKLARRQLPAKLAFAITIHKAQGQTIPYLGLFVPRPVFAHGQLYVALYRVSSQDRVKIAIQNPAKEDKEGTFTKNIVYADVIKSEPSNRNA